MEFLSKKRTFQLTASVLLGGFALLYFSLFYFPALPVHFQGGDASTYMFNACRMLRGEVIYRDFFEFTPPGTEVFYYLVFKIFGVHAWIPNVVLIGLGLGIAWLMILISRNVIPGKAAYLPAALFLVVPFRSKLDPTHHWFSTLAAMAAIALLVENVTALRLVGAGALCGVAMCFTQSTGLPAVLGLALYLLWAATTRRLSWLSFRRGQFYIWSSFSIVVVLFNAYFVFQAGLRTFLSETVVFGLRYWPTLVWNTPATYMIDMPNIHPWYRLPAAVIWFSVYLLTPLIYLLFFVRYLDQRTDRPSEPWDRLMLIAITGIVLFLGVVAAPSWLRMCVVAPPGIILFVWFLNTPGRFRSLRTASVWVIIIGLAVGECVELRFAWREQVKLPIGRVAELNRDQYEEIKFLLARTKPGDYFFGKVDLNYLLDLRNPSPIPFLTSSDYTRPEQVRRTLQGLKNHPVRYVLWWSNLDMPPEIAHSTNHLVPLRAYLHSNYHLVKRIEGADSSFWEKRNLQAPTVVPRPEHSATLPRARLSAPPAAPRLPLALWRGFLGPMVSRTRVFPIHGFRQVPAQKAVPAALGASGDPHSARHDWLSVG